MKIISWYINNKHEEIYLATELFALNPTLKKSDFKVLFKEYQLKFEKTIFDTHTMKRKIYSIISKNKKP